MNLENILKSLQLSLNEVYDRQTVGLPKGQSKNVPIAAGANPRYFSFKRDGIEYTAQNQGNGVWVVKPVGDFNSGFQKAKKSPEMSLSVYPDGRKEIGTGKGKSYKVKNSNVGDDWGKQLGTMVSDALGLKYQEDQAAAARRQAAGNVVSAGGANNIYNVNSPTQATLTRSDVAGGQSQSLGMTGAAGATGNAGTTSGSAPDYNAQFDAYWEPINALLNQRYQDVLVPEFNRYTMNPFNAQYAHNAAQNYQSMVGAGKQQYEDKRSYIANQFENQVDTMRQNAMKDALNVWQGQQKDIQNNTDLTQALAPYVEKYASWTPEPVQSSQTSNPVYSQLVTPGAMKDIYSGGKPPVYPGGLTLSKPN